MFHFSFKIVNIVCEAKSEGRQDPNIHEELDLLLFLLILTVLTRL